jgi:hypothetical protein
MHLVADVASPAVVILVIITIVPAIVPSCAQTAGLALWYSGTKIVHGMGVSNNLATNIDTGITKVRKDQCTVLPKVRKQTASKLSYVLTADEACLPTARDQVL